MASIDRAIFGRRTRIFDRMHVGNDNCDIVPIYRERILWASSFYRGCSSSTSSLIWNAQEKIDIAVYDILHVLGIRCGMAHLEIKIIENEIYFIEVGARGGGDHIADTLTLLSTGFDYFRAAIECSLGKYKHQKICNVAYSGIYFIVSKIKD